MDREEHLLTIFQEECAEVIQEVSKAKRFGLDEQRDLPTSNRERIQKEWNDVLAMKEMLMDEGIITLQPNRSDITAKKIKVEKYLKYSQELGALDTVPKAL